MKNKLKASFGIWNLSSFISSKQTRMETFYPVIVRLRTFNGGVFTLDLL